MDNNTKIKELKAEVFDLLAAQDNLRIQFARLEEAKAKKLQELAEAQQPEPEKKTE